MPMPSDQGGSTKRSSIQMPIGKLWTRGDMVKAPDGASSKIRNCVLRRGQIEKRPGWLYEATLLAATTPGRLFHGIYATTEGLVYGGTTTKGAYRDGSAIWQSLGTGIGIATKDATNYNGKLWVLCQGDGSNPGSLFSFDGTTVTNNATTTRITGASIDSFIGRLFVGAPRFLYTNGGNNYFAFATAEWTKSGGPPTIAAGPPSTLTIVNGTTDAIKLAAAAYTTGAADEEYVTYVHWIQAVQAANSVPITMTIEDAGGTNVYGSAEYFVQSATAEPNWISYSVTARVPASTAVYPKLKIGNSAANGTVGNVIRLGNSTKNYGASVYPGHFVYPYGSIASVTATGYTEYADKVYFSEPLDETDWRNENYVSCTETPGTITAVRATKNKLIVYKPNAMWVFRATSDVTNPIIRENYMEGIGCQTVQSISTLDDTHFFVGRNEIYIYDGSDYPQPIAGEGMKDELFGSTNMVSTPLIAVDSDAREVWVHTQKYKIHVFSLDQQQWIGYYQLTDSSASETPFGSTYGQILDLEYLQPQGEANREMWILFTNAAGTNVIAKLRQSQTQDNLDGTNRDIVAEYVFHPLETGRPRNQVTVQTIGLDHRVTSSQTGSTTRYSVSLDNGNTWTKYNDVTLTPLSAGVASDTQIMRVPVHQTSPRLVLKIQHTGLGGASYFNLTGGQADIILRGREVQATNPTAVTSNL